MKFLLVILLLASQCQPEPKKHKSSKHPAKHSANQQITSDANSIIVPASWLKDYKRLEQKYGTIPEDSCIWPDGEKYHIPRESASKYIEMSKLELSHEH